MKVQGVEVKGADDGREGLRISLGFPVLCDIYLLVLCVFLGGHMAQRRLKTTTFKFHAYTGDH